MSHSLKLEFQTAGLAEQDAGLLARLVHVSPAVLYSCKVAEDCGTIAVTGNVRRVLGYAPEDFTGDPSFWAVRIHPDDSGRVFAEMPHLFREGEQTIDYRFQHADGRYIQLRDRMTLERDAEGHPLRILGCWLEVADVSRVNLISHTASETTRTETAGGTYAQ